MSCLLLHPCDSCISGCSVPHLQLVGFLPLLHPKRQNVWADLPWAAAGAEGGSVQLIPGEVLSLQGWYANSGWQQHCLRQGKSCSVSLLLEASSGMWAKAPQLLGRAGLPTGSVFSPSCCLRSSLLATREYWLCLDRWWSLDALSHQPGLCALRHAGSYTRHIEEAVWIVPVYQEVQKCEFCASLQRLIVKLHSCRRKLWNRDQGTWPESRAHMWTRIHLLLTTAGQNHNKRAAESGIECKIPHINNHQRGTSFF